MKQLLNKVLQGYILTADEAATAMRGVLSGDAPAEQTAALLATLQMRGLHLTELQGFRLALDESGQTIDLQEFAPIDVCGTGGDGKHTFNISTLTAFVLAGAGVKVAKHGNYAATSGCGSSDVLQHLGLKFTADETALRRQIAETNICYLHAPLFQPALKAVAPIRKAIGFRTFFNSLGPLLNPARPLRQFIGVSDPATLRLYRYFLEDSGPAFAVVTTRDGYDEISLTAAFDVATNEGVTTYTPEDIGFPTVAAHELNNGANIGQAAEQFLGILRGTSTPAQEAVVIANAAFALRLARPEKSLDECRKQATESLRDGHAQRCFIRLQTLSATL